MNWDNLFWTSINQPWHSFRQGDLCRPGVAIRVDGEVLLIGDISKSGAMDSAFIKIGDHEVVESATDLLTNGSLDPVRRALTDFLNYLDSDDIVFRKNDGSPVSVGQMLIMIKENDPLVESFLEDVYGAAVRAVRVKSKTEPLKSSPVGYIKVQVSEGKSTSEWCTTFEVDGKCYNCLVDKSLVKDNSLLKVHVFGSGSEYTTIGLPKKSIQGDLCISIPTDMLIAE